MEKPSIWEIANNPNQPVIGPGIIGTKLATRPVIIRIIEIINSKSTDNTFVTEIIPTTTLLGSSK